MADNNTENFENNNENSIDYIPRNNNNVQLSEEDFLKNFEFRSLSSASVNNQSIENKFKESYQEQISNIKNLYYNKNINDIYQNSDKLEKSKIGSLIPFKLYIKLKFCDK